MATGARAQKPVGSAAWIATEKENVAEMIQQEMEEVEYPVRHEMDWLNEHMTEIFSKGQANFTDVFKTPGKMRGKTPRTARKRNVEEDRVPLSEIFSSAHKQVENKASPSPFIHRVISKASAATNTTTTSTTAPASPRPKESEKVLQPQYPDLSQNLNSFQKYNTDSGYHGMEDDDDMVLPSTQPDTQTSTQPMEVEEPTPLNSQADVSMSLQAADDSFHSAQENVRARGETIEPMNIDSTPIKKQAAMPTKPSPKEAEVEMEPEKNSTPTPKVQSKFKSIGDKQKQTAKPTTSQEPAPMDSSPQKPITTSPPSMEKETQDKDMDNEDAKDDTVLDNFDDIGSPSDNSTPERLPVRKSSLSFASLPAREPLTKSVGGSRLSRTSHIDLPKLNSGGRLSYLGRQTGGHRMTQITAEENAGVSGSIDIDDDKDTGANMDAEQTSKLQSTTPAQSLHERISMLGKPQPSRAKKSIAAPAIGLGSASQVAYPDLSTTKSAGRNESSGSKSRDTPPSSEAPAGDEDWIPQRPNLQKSKTADVVENLNIATSQPAAKKNNTQDHSAEPERPKSAYSIFSSPRPQGHQQSASTSNIITEASTTPTGSPRRYEGPLSASKLRLHSIMKSAKGLFTSTGSARFELSSPEQPRVQAKEQVNTQKNEDEEEDSHKEQSRQVASPPRQEGRRTRSSTEREEKQRQRELEEQQREESRQEEARQEEARQEKAREQERQRAIQLKAAQNKSSVEPEERSTYKSSQSLRQQSREPESNQEGSRIAMPQSKQNDRRPKPTRELLQKPKPQPVSVRVGSTLPRGMTMSSANSQDMSGPAPAPTPASKQSTLKKKPSNNSLHTTSSTSSFKSSISTQSQAQRKAQLASERKREQEERRREQEERKREQEERKREQEEREAKKKEDQRREQERKRALQMQQQEEARWQAESRAEQERERREQSAQEDSKRAANKQAIENWRLENAARKQEPSSTRPASRLGSMQPYGRSINPPAANPAKPPKRMMDEDAGHRPAVSKPSNVLPSGESKRRKTEDEHNPMQPVRPAMARPIRQPSSSIRKPSMFGQSGIQPGSSILKNQPQRPVANHPIDMSKLAHGKIPFAEPNHAPPPAAHRAPAASSSQRTPGPAKPSPKYPSGENIHLPEIATDSEDEDDSDAEMFPVPKWAQAKELEGLLQQQDGMEVDSIFGPIAPFSLEETFKADKKIKKYRDRTSSANWSGPDGLTQEEIRRDVADRQRLRLNGGWSFNP